MNYTGRIRSSVTSVFEASPSVPKVIQYCGQLLKQFAQKKSFLEIIEDLIKKESTILSSFRTNW
jgi:hypothetical protein